MSTTITRPDLSRRLRLVNAEEARATGAADAQQLLAEAFPADEIRTPADALYSALIEFISLAHDNRFEECNERLKGFFEVVGPVLYRPQVSAAIAQSDAAAKLREPKSLSVRESNDAYGAGCRAGHQAADEWLSNPHRGDSKYGGTLQHVLLELAGRMSNAQTEEEIERTRGEIVGFSYRIECPADSIACEEAMANATKRRPMV